MQGEPGGPGLKGDKGFSGRNGEAGFDGASGEAVSKDQIFVILPKDDYMTSFFEQQMQINFSTDAMGDIARQQNVIQGIIRNNAGLPDLKSFYLFHSREIQEQPDHQDLLEPQENL